MPEQQSSGPIGCLVRLFWMAFGNLVLALCVIGIVQSGSLDLGGLDAIYWLTVVALLGVRYVDIRYLDGTTTDGQRATMAHYTHYAAVLTGVALAGWLGAYAWVRFVAQA